MNITNLIENDLLISTPAAHLYEFSPFRELRKLPPGTKGSRFEKIVEDAMIKMGYEVEKATSYGHDRIINGVKTEIKGATLHYTANKEWKFSFLQIRMEHDWDQLLLICFWPQDARIFTITKEQVQDLIDRGVIRRDHGGKDSKNDLYAFRGHIEDLTGAVEAKSLVDSPKKAELKVVG